MSATATTISFARGVPSADLLPSDDIAAAVARALEKDAPGVLAYGDAFGYGALRAWIGERYDQPTDRVMLANGSLQGLAFLAEHLFSGSGGRAVVEAPTYDRALLTLRRFGATIDPIALDADGLDVEALEAEIRTGRVPGLVYTIPNFQNPAGATLSREKRERLVALAAEHGFLILEDDPYGDLRFEGADEPRLRDLDGAGRVIFSTSFTKTIAPGLRTGALLLPPGLVPGMRKLATDTYIGPCGLAEATIAEYCAAGCFEAGLERVRPLLRERRDALTAAIDRHLGERAEYVVPAGGYFLWLRLPGVDTDALAAHAETAGVPFVRGSSCYLGSGQGTDELRLAFSAVKPEDIDPGIARLAALLP